MIVSCSSSRSSRLWSIVTVDSSLGYRTRLVPLSMLSSDRLSESALVCSGLLLLGALPLGALFPVSVIVMPYVIVFGPQKL